MYGVNTRELNARGFNDACRRIAKLTLPSTIPRNSNCSRWSTDVKLKRCVCVHTCAYCKCVRSKGHRQRWSCRWRDDPYWSYLELGCGVSLSLAVNLNNANLVRRGHVRDVQGVYRSVKREGALRVKGEIAACFRVTVIAVASSTTRHSKKTELRCTCN